MPIRRKRVGRRWIGNDGFQATRFLNEGMSQGMNRFDRWNRLSLDGAVICPMKWFSRRNIGPPRDVVRRDCVG